MKVRRDAFIIGFILLSLPRDTLSAAPLGGYWTWTTQFVANTTYPYPGFDGTIQVALPDKYVKRCIIAHNCSTSYPQGRDYTVNFYDNVQNVNNMGVGEVGPWNITDNWWDPSPPTAWPRPRHEFTDLPQGTSEAQQAVCCGYNGGYDDGQSSTYPRIITSKPYGPGMDLSTSAGKWLGWGAGENRWVYIYTFNWDDEPSTGTIQINATLNGAPWPSTATGTLGYFLAGPSPINGTSVPATLIGEAPGAYILTYTSGGPSGATYTSITPVPAQSVFAGGSLTFTINFNGGSCGPVGGRVGVDCTPPPTCYSLTLSRNNASGGSLPTSSPASSSGCSTGQYVSGEHIQLTATPASGWNVVSWTGTDNDASTSATNTLTMPAANRTVMVNYGTASTGPPIVTTGGADGITATTATLHGTVNPNGLGTNVKFGYTTDQVNYSYTSPQYMGMGTSTASFLANLSGLACQTSYWYYAIAYNSAGAIGGYLQPFTTASCAPAPRPSVLSASVEGITQTSAVLHASVDPNGVPTSVYFLYDTTTNTGNSTPSTSLSGSGAQPVAIPISALSCGTTYYYRPIAYNTNTGQGTTLDWQSFNTNPCSAAGTSFYTLTPCRILDTRTTGNPISASSGLRLQITGICGIPPTATAVALNVTAVGATSQGILSLYPLGSVPPNYTVAFGAGQTRAGSTVVGLSSIGTLNVFCYMPSGQGQTDYVIDVSGYFQ